jgi:hypothetical protein
MDNGLGLFLKYLLWIVGILTTGYILFFIYKMLAEFKDGMVRLKNKILRLLR